MGTAGWNKLTYVRVADMVYALEAHEDQLHLDSTDCVTTGVVGSGRVSRGRRKRAAVEHWRIAALSLEHLFFTTATTISLFLGLFGLFNSALGRISGLTFASALRRGRRHDGAPQSQDRRGGGCGRPARHGRASEG